jgi:Kef-type K+ transport system membrane component KefB
MALPATMGQSDIAVPLQSTIQRDTMSKGTDWTMDNTLLVATVAGGLILLASMASVEFGLSVAITEILLGIVGGNLLGLHTTPWIDFLASFASIVLTFLAGAEVDPDLLREKWKESLLIGGLSFLIPFLLAIPVLYFVFGWSSQAAEIGGVALSTTSLAVVYAVLVETGLTATPIGKLIMPPPSSPTSAPPWRSACCSSGLGCC